MKAAQSCFDQFASTSAIRGFSFIKHSSCIGEQIFWALIILFGTGMTVSTVLDTVRKYADGKTASRVDIVNNATITIDSSTVCLALNFSAFDYGVDIHNKTSMENFLANFSNEKAIVSLLATNYAEIRKSQQSGIANAFKDPLAYLVRLTAAMLSSIVRLEVSKTRVDELWSFIKKLPTGNVLEGNRTAAPFHRVFTFYAERQTNFQALLAVTCKHLCAQMSLYLIHFDAAIDVCSDCFWLGQLPDSLKDIEALCVRMATDARPLVFENPFTWSILGVNETALYRRADVPPRSAMITLGSGEFGGKNIDCSIIVLGGFHYLEVQLLARFQLWNADGTRCESRGSYHRCEFRCKALHIHRHCECVPISSYYFSANQNRSESRDCGLQLALALKNYTLTVENETLVCLQAVYTYEADAIYKECMRVCHIECRNDLFSYNVRQLLAPASQDGSIVSLVFFRMSRFMYQEVEQYLVMDTSTFITSIGGNLSLWLGASFLGLLHIVVFMLKAPFVYRGAAVEKKRDAKAAVVPKGHSSTFGDTPTAVFCQT